MGLASLRAFLLRHRKIALDTSIFIYQFEAHPRYVALTDPIFGWLERSGNQAVTSTITMMELLVQPYREIGTRRIKAFYALLTTYPNLEWIAADIAIADLAAQIRATHRLQTPDALQAATAANAGATGLVTNDPVFARIANFETLVLDQLLEPRII